MRLMDEATPNKAKPSEADMLAKNHQFYTSLWAAAHLVQPELFNTWPLISDLITQYPRRLEVAPGLRPRLPVAGTQFVDISLPALEVLQQQGGSISSASINQLPFDNHCFDLVCALDIIEHVDDDLGAMSELSRVAADNAILLISTPLHAAFWTPFDELVGHRRRYAPTDFVALLKSNGFEVLQSAAFGMKPKSSRLVNLGMYLLQRNPKRAMWWYNKIMPLTLRFQKPLILTQGLIDTDQVGEIFLVCRKTCAQQLNNE